MSNYEDFLQQVEFLTDPENQTMEKFEVLINAPTLMAISALRSSAATVRDRMEQDDVHAGIFREEMATNLAKMEKTAALLVRDAARAYDRINDCQCHHCRASMADYN